MKNTLKIIKKIISDIVSLLLVLILVLSLVQRITGSIPGIFGYHMMYVLTGSMEPVISAGDAVIVKECGPEDLKAGDIVSYYGQSEETKGLLITHQLTEDPYSENGLIMLRTRGIANASDDEPFSSEYLFGRVIAITGILGKVYSFFCTVPGLIVALSPILFSMITEIVHIVKLLKEEEDQPQD